MKDESMNYPPSPRRFSLFPKSLGQTLTPTLKPIYKKHGFTESRILTEWNAIVGPELGGASVPQKLAMPRGKKEGGTLHLLAASGRALELQHLQPVILSKIATYFGYAAVKRLAFTQVPGALFRKEKQAGSLKPAVPGARLMELTSQCEDDRLRAALLSLGALLPGVEN